MDAKQTISVKPDKIRLVNLLEDISEGKISIPIFQREFVWKTNQMVELFDSISKGFPVGSLLFWKPENKYKTFEKIGVYTVPPPTDNYYVLDGFQRITTLFGVLTNPQKHNKKEKDLKEYLIYYNLSKMEFASLRSRKDRSDYYVPLYQLFDTFGYLEIIDDIRNNISEKTKQNDLIQRAKEFNKIFLDYHVPFVEIKGGDISSAVQIFSRVNSTGQKITEDFMLSALSYDDVTGFLLSKAITEFLGDLNQFNFDDLSRKTVLNCIQNANGRIYFDVKIEDLLLPNFDLQKFSQNTFDNIKKAVEFLYKRINVLVLGLLPYPTQLIFISEYFRLNPNPTNAQLNDLERWFWITTYSNYFTIYSLSQQRAAYQEFCKFAIGSHPDGIYKIDNEQGFSTAKYPTKINFGGVRPKALQLFYLKSIVNNEEIQEREGIKEIFITSKKDRTPANIIFRLSSEFEKNQQNKTVKGFIENSSLEELSKHFITQEMVTLYKQNNLDEFISKREKLIKSKEAEFVKKLGIKYSNN